MFGPVLGALLGTSFLVSDDFRKERQVCCEYETMSGQADADGNVSYGSSTSLPTFISSSVPSVLQPAPTILEGRDTALTEIAPSLPDPPKGWRQPSRHLHWIARHETDQGGQHEIGNASLTFDNRQLKHSMVQARLPIPKTRNFVDSDGLIPQTFSTGAMPARNDLSEYDYNYEQFAMTRGLHRDERVAGQLYPHQIRKTEPDLKSMPPTFKFKGYTPGSSFIEISETRRKNANPTSIPRLKNAYHGIRMDPDTNFGIVHDRTIAARTPYVRGMAPPTRGALVDMNTSMKEDHVLPGRQPGVSFNQTTVRKPFRQPQDFSDSRKVAAENLTYRGRANIPSAQSAVTMHDGKQTTRDQTITITKGDGTSYNGRTNRRAISTVTGTPGIDTQIANRAPLAARHDIYTDYYIDKITKPVQRPDHEAFKNVGFHETTNFAPSEFQRTRFN